MSLADLEADFAAFEAQFIPETANPAAEEPTGPRMYEFRGQTCSEAELRQKCPFLRDLGEAAFQNVITAYEVPAPTARHEKIFQNTEPYVTKTLPVFKKNEAYEEAKLAEISATPDLLQEAIFIEAIRERDAEQFITITESNTVTESQTPHAKVEENIVVSEIPKTLPKQPLYKNVPKMQLAKRATIALEKPAETSENEADLKIPPSVVTESTTYKEPDTALEVAPPAAPPELHLVVESVRQAEEISEALTVQQITEDMVFLEEHIGEDKIQEDFNPVLPEEVATKLELFIDTAIEEEVALVESLSKLIGAATERLQALIVSGELDGVEAEQIQIKLEEWYDLLLTTLQIEHDDETVASFIRNLMIDIPNNDELQQDYESQDEGTHEKKPGVLTLAHQLSEDAGTLFQSLKLGRFILQSITGTN
jgi:hypothetical protein